MSTLRSARVDELVRVRFSDGPAANGSAVSYPDYGTVAAHCRYLLQQASDETSEANAIEFAKGLLWAYNLVETLGYVDAVADGMGFAVAPPPEA